MLVFHVDANSAYLSWTAASLLEKGYPTDIRTLPSAIAGDPQNRHGIILAKSIPAKKCGVQTAESILEAKQKCPDLQIFPPDYDLFLLCSDAMHEILSQYTPLIQRYSVDESFMDCSRCPEIRRAPVETAFAIKEKIKETLGFTVNIGVGNNKAMAKMAGELKKPDMVHTLWPEEIPKKLWPLPVSELFMVGRATTRKLCQCNITTIGDLARADVNFLRSILKSHGQLVHDYANGIDPSPVIINGEVEQKGLGNSLTLPYDATTKKELFLEALALCERVGMRLRRLNRRASLVSVYLKNSSFSGCGHQVQLPIFINSTSEIYGISKQLIEECWNGQPVRQLGISVSRLSRGEELQLSLWDASFREKQERLDQAVDRIRSAYGERSITRGTFANSSAAPIQGGVNDGNYLMMGGFQS